MTDPAQATPPNASRRGSTNRGRNLGPGVIAVPPVRLYGEAKVEEGCTLGKYTYLGNRAHVANADIGSYCAIARGAEIGAKPHPTHMLSTHPFQYEQTHFVGQPGYDLPVGDWTTVSPGTRTTIGDDVWVGTMAVVSHSVTVGTGAVIGSNAVVTRDVPPYAIVGGVPARVIRHRFDEPTIDRLLASRWWLLDPADMADVDFADVPGALDEVARRRAAWAAQVRAALARQLRNAEDLTGEGVLWVDVERSYAVPEVIGEFRVVEVDEGSPIGFPSGTHPIREAWFDPVTTAFGVWTGVHDGPLPDGTVAFRLR